jgi:hypothetical protein
LAACTDRRCALCTTEAGARRRASGAVTVTAGKLCAPPCVDDCASDACGTKTQADAVANTADRSIPRLFNAPPQSCMFDASCRGVPARHALKGDAYERARDFPN